MRDPESTTSPFIAIAAWVFLVGTSSLLNAIAVLVLLLAFRLAGHPLDAVVWKTVALVLCLVSPIAVLQVLTRASEDSESPAETPLKPGAPEA